MLSSLILAWALSANPGLASYENLWRAKTGTVAPKTVDWSPIVRGISISSHILARLLIDDGEKRKGYFLSISPSLTPSFIIALTPSLSPFHLSRKHPNNTLFWPDPPSCQKAIIVLYLYIHEIQNMTKTVLYNLSLPLCLSLSLSHPIFHSLSLFQWLCFNRAFHKCTSNWTPSPSLSLSLSFIPKSLNLKKKERVKQHK